MCPHQQTSLKGHPHLAILPAILLAIVLLTHPHLASLQQRVRKLREIQASTLSNIAGNVATIIASNTAGNVDPVQLSSNIARNFQSRRN